MDATLPTFKKKSRFFLFFLFQTLHHLLPDLLTWLRFQNKLDVLAIQIIEIFWQNIDQVCLHIES